MVVAEPEGTENNRAILQAGPGLQTNERDEQLVDERGKGGEGGPGDGLVLDGVPVPVALGLDGQCREQQADERAGDGGLAGEEIVVQIHDD
jgi:hypothetical protein